MMLGAKILLPTPWQILAPQFWYQNSGTKMMGPKLWYPKFGTQILVPNFGTKEWYLNDGRQGE